MKRLLSAFACAVLLASVACGSSSPTAPSAPQALQVAGNYSGTAVITYTQLAVTVNASATMTVTQAGNAVNLASLVFTIPNYGTLSLPLGETTIDATGAVSGQGMSASNVWSASCNAYQTYSATGTFVGRQFQGSMLATFSSTAGGCYNFTLAVTLNR